MLSSAEDTRKILWEGAQGKEWKVGGRGQLREVPGKSIVNKGEVVTQI